MTKIGYNIHGFGEIGILYLILSASNVRLPLRSHSPLQADRVVLFSESYNQVEGEGRRLLCRAERAATDAAALGAGGCPY